MPEIALYGVAVSAFVAKVRIALDVKGATYDEAAPPDGYGSPAYRAIVPAGSVPGVVINGRPLSDSNAIIEYLEELQPQPALFPASAYDRARARALLGFHDTRVEAAARTLFPVVKGDWRGEPAKVEVGVAAIEAALDRISDMIRPAPFVFGEAPTIADMAFPVTLQMAEMLAAEMERPLRVAPDIDAWRRATSETPAVARSLSIAREAMEGWLAGFR
ncbi:MAG: glutathione S-transferase family protein [Pseudomonadota bacterium]